VDYSLKTAVVVAGGWSVRPGHIDALNDTRDLDIICVNDAIFSIRRPNCVVTMDRKWMVNRYAEVKKNLTHVYYRRCATKGVPRIINPDDCAFENNNLPGMMSGWTVPFRLDGNNSGACAMNLAFLRRYHRVFLLGYDMQKGPEGQNHFYPDYPWNVNATKPTALKGWAGSFGEAAEQFRRRGTAVFNVNDRSLIKDFPVISFDQFRSMVSHENL
jgi:hypothetical protein